MGYQVIFVMGVSGSGKSTIGSLLAKELNVPFFDGDDYHPESNIQKMQSGIPLQDDDRYWWLSDLNELARTELTKHSLVIACSALKESYRQILRRGLEDASVFIFLKGNFETINKRMAERENHFMPENLLQSQFDTLETPNYGIHVDMSMSPTESVYYILEGLRL